MPFQKRKFTCDSFNLIYIIVCPNCNEEYIGETGIGKSKLRDRVRVHRQHIKQPEYATCNVSKHLRTCGRGNFKIFPLLQLKENSTDLRRTIELDFIKKYKVKLN